MPTICVLSSVHSPYDHRVRKEFRSLVRAGHRVVVVAPHDADTTVDGAAVRAVPVPAGRVARVSQTMARLWREARALDADAYHLHDPELLGLGVALAALGYPVVYDRHEDAPRDMVITKDYLPLPLRWAASWTVRALEQLGALAFAGIVIATEQMRPDFPTARRVVAVRNFPDLEMFADGAESRPRAGTLELVYAGNISEVRGAVRLVEAMHLLPADVHARLSFYGLIDPPDLRERLAAMPGWQRCRYGGNLDHAEIPAAMHAAHVGMACLQPVETYVNAVPTKLYEYMAAGVAIIASDFPLYREVLARGPSGLAFDPTSPTAIAGAITTLARDAELLRRCGTRGPAVAAEFAWEGEANRLVALYDAVLGRA